jgi:hypothetical protein
MRPVQRNEIVLDTQDGKSYVYRDETDHNPATNVRIVSYFSKLRPIRSSTHPSRAFSRGSEWFLMRLFILRISDPNKFNLTSIFQELIDKGKN